MEALGCTPEEVVATYPEALAKRLGIDPGWVGALQKGNAPPMPAFQELTLGLEAMLD